ncbi:TPA: hypothetical protein N0F65_006604 [Lagenidium giganteum]|uniref:Uncharacterized protein n=1 Tax=Lagenidium giganteum TaxID=4803 RepID=A0AAV2Z9X3_9STRA|nr:TPA: hypothetical protein N0F65_006604 [Lagenidium giganteum]
MSKPLTDELRAYFRGLKRQVASNTAAGNVRCKVGNDPLPFSVHRHRVMQMLASTGRDMIFGRAFMIMSWNLMSRAANTLEIMHDNMEYIEDALRVYFAQMKNDQLGERPRDPRHICANPIYPEVCPLVALGVVWLTYGFSDSDHRLFAGSRQYNRFSSVFDRALKQAQPELQRRGIQLEDIGCHSIRNGSASYCSSGSTMCPSSTSVHLKAGWALGGVQDRYRRTAAGLPINKPEFATLPPRFKDSDNVQLQDAISTCFPAAPASVTRVVEFTLASVVHHRAFLEANTPPTHPLKSSTLYTTPGMLIDCMHSFASRNDDGAHASSQQPATNPSSAELHDITVGTAEKHEADVSTSTIYCWGGIMRRLPATFEFPKVSVSAAWQPWQCGGGRRNYPPFRSLEPNDMPTTNARKRLSDSRFLMNKIEDAENALESIWMLP